MKSLVMMTGMLMTASVVMGQHTLRGTVSSESGGPLPGASILLKDANKITIADGDGNFSLSDVDGGDYTLAASFVGYTTQSMDISVNGDLEINFLLKEEIFKGEEVFVYATRANEKIPTTYSDVSKEEIEERNMGQDLPFILQHTPSAVVNSDAGAGIGYTGIRIRGSDQSRINVTINGVPVNDPESHGVFWVNMPDFSSSVNNIQIQRGVGTSTNGAAAFGATINMQTSLPSQEAYAQLDNSIGSFNTRKHTAIYNTGLINDRWSFEGRLSQIVSDGYIDRAASDLKSYYLSGGYYGKKTTIKALSFAGKEVTYQSWYGTPQARLENDEEGLQDVIAWGGEYDTQEKIDNLLNSDRRFNYYLYENEVDHYQQDHYQLHMNHQFNPALNAQLSLHYTYGRGYFEQYKEDDDLNNYQIPEIQISDSTISTTDLVRRRWLDNHFYGATYSVNYQQNRWNATLGGGYNYYDGDHFGEVIWARNAGNGEIRDRYYDNFGRKSDFNAFTKANFQVTDRINLFGDLQIRTIDYHTQGIDNDLRMIDAGDQYAFFNPKIGLTYTLNDHSTLYGSYAVGNREPVRTDFIDAPEGETPRPEKLENIEIGYKLRREHYVIHANYYLMNYQDQLVLTGALNDVGASLRTNVPESYRSGIEISGGIQFFNGFEWEGNVTLSRNKIKRFTEIAYDYAYEDDQFLVVNTFTDTDISFSPNVIAASTFSYSPIENLSVALLSKYVSKQYLDNTGNEERVINPYFINDLRIDYHFRLEGISRLGLSLLINNLTNVKYSANGYTWGYLYDGFRYQQNNYYPQAGRNFLARLTLKF